MCEGIWQNLRFKQLKISENEVTLILLGQNWQDMVQFDGLLRETLEMADYMTNCLGD